METIRDQRFGMRYLIRNLVKTVPLGVGFIFLWRDWDRWEAQFWFGIASLAGGIAWWAWQDRHLLRSYHCPRCGAHLPGATIEPRGEGDPLCFYSGACDVEWDTTLRH